MLSIYNGSNFRYYKTIVQITTNGKLIFLAKFVLLHNLPERAARNSDWWQYLYMGIAPCKLVSKLYFSKSTPFTCSCFANPYFIDIIYMHCYC